MITELVPLWVKIIYGVWCVFWGVGYCVEYADKSKGAKACIRGIFWGWFPPIMLVEWLGGVIVDAVRYVYAVVSKGYTRIQDPFAHKLSRLNVQRELLQGLEQSELVKAELVELQELILRLQVERSSSLRRALELPWYRSKPKSLFE